MEQVRDVEGERLRIEAAQRDPSRFGVLYEEHFDRVYAYIVRRVGDRSEAQDLTSEVFHQALANLGRFEWRGAPFAAWLYRIAANAVTDHYHRARREASAPIADEPAADEIEIIEQRAALFRSVGALPTDQRRVIVMRFAEEKSIREVSQEIGRSEGAVKQLQWRALQTLRNRLGSGRGSGQGQDHG